MGIDSSAPSTIRKNVVDHADRLHDAPEDAS